MPKASYRTSPGRKPRTSSRRTKASSSGGVEYIQIGLTLPRFYLDVLESDANYLGIRRAQVLELILLRKLGLLTAERTAGAPKYSLKKADLETTERFIWYLRPDLKKRFDDLRMKMGNIRPGAWLVLAINEWIGLPSGVGA